MISKNTGNIIITCYTSQHHHKLAGNHELSAGMFYALYLEKNDRENGLLIALFLSLIWVSQGIPVKLRFQFLNGFH